MDDSKNKFNLGLNMRGGIMFEVTEKASEVIKTFLENQKGRQSIGIMTQAG
jgi:hypothetical protein